LGDRAESKGGRYVETESDGMLRHLRGGLGLRDRDMDKEKERDR
jgi:hypothetical protein